MLEIISAETSSQLIRKSINRKLIDTNSDDKLLIAGVISEADMRNKMKLTNVFSSW